jgi:hypothetical protein
MLAFRSDVKGSAGLCSDGMTAQFAERPHGQFRAATQRHDGTRRTVVVVAGSGTGALVGLEGSMAIIIEDGKHSYEFGYTLPVL